MENDFSLFQQFMSKLGYSPTSSSATTVTTPPMIGNTSFGDSLNAMSVNMPQGTGQMSPVTYGTPTATAGFDMGSMADWAPILQGLGALGQAYTGMKQVGVMEDNLNFQRDAFGKQFQAQANTVNADLSDRQAQRIRWAGGEDAAAAQGIMSVSDYMNKYGIKA